MPHFLRIECKSCYNLENFLGSKSSGGCPDEFGDTENRKEQKSMERKDFAR